jgi:hypothetical protein
MLKRKPLSVASMANSMVAVAWLLTKPVRWNHVLPAPVAAASVVVLAAVAAVTAAVAVDAPAAAAVVDTAAVAADAPAAAVTAVAVAPATKLKSA